MLNTLFLQVHWTLEVKILQALSPYTQRQRAGEALFKREPRALCAFSRAMHVVCATRAVSCSPHVHARAHSVLSRARWVFKRNFMPYSGLTSRSACRIRPPPPPPPFAINKASTKIHRWKEGTFKVVCTFRSIAQFSVPTHPRTLDLTNTYWRVFNCFYLSFTTFRFVHEWMCAKVEELSQ